MVTYNYKNKEYQIVIGDEGKYNKQREKQILSDFLFCEKNGDYLTIENRIINGVKWGWLKQRK
jgi:hypothetical protein